MKNLIKKTKAGNIACLILLAITLPANAEVFKCTGSDGMIKYQSKPCADLTMQKSVTIKSRSQKAEAEAAENLRKWYANYNEEQARIAQAEKERAASELKAAEVAAMQNTAIAHSQQADALYKQEKQMQIENNLHSFFGK